MMKSFQDETGNPWVASAREEQTPRHHGRWYLVIHPAGQPERLRPMAEVRWQSRASAQRTLATMSDFELRRRLHVLLEREGVEAGGSPDGGASPGALRVRTSASAG
jgi:hypothetical protein